MGVVRGLLELLDSNFGCLRLTYCLVAAAYCGFVGLGVIDLWSFVGV